MQSVKHWNFQLSQLNSLSLSSSVIQKVRHLRLHHHCLLYIQSLLRSGLKSCGREGCFLVFSFLAFPLRFWCVKSRLLPALNSLSGAFNLSSPAFVYLRLLFWLVFCFRVKIDSRIIEIFAKVFAFWCISCSSR